MDVPRPYITYMDAELARLSTDELLAHRKKVTAYLLANDDDDAAAHLRRVKAVAAERLATQARRDAEPRQDAPPPAKTEPKVERIEPKRRKYIEGLPTKALAMDLTPHQFMVFVAIVSRANGEGTCFQGCKRLAADTGLNIKTIVAALPRLRDLGMIFWRKGIFGGTNTYKVRSPAKWTRSRPPEGNQPVRRVD